MAKQRLPKFFKDTQKLLGIFTKPNLICAPSKNFEHPTLIWHIFIWPTFSWPVFKLKTLNASVQALACAYTHATPRADDSQPDSMWMIEARPPREEERAWVLGRAGGAGGRPSFFPGQGAVQWRWEQETKGGEGGKKQMREEARLQCVT